MKYIAHILLWLSVGALMAANLENWILHPMHTEADQSVYLAMAKLVLQGKIPYVDFFDFNPPLIIYLNVIPVWLGTRLNLPLPMSFDIFVYGLLTLSILLVYFIFRKTDWSIKAATFPIIFALVIFTRYQYTDFGQREHLFTLMFMPFLLLRSLAAGGLPMPIWLSISTALLAAIGANLKPQFFVIAAVTELTVLLKNGFRPNIKEIKRWLKDPAVSTFAAVTLVYLVHFLFYGEEVRKIFFEQAIPIYLEGVGFYAHSLISGLACAENFAWPFYWTIAALIIALPFERYSKLICPLVAFIITSFVIYMQSGMTWTYRLLPIQGGCNVLLGVELGIVLGAFLISNARSRELIATFISLLVFGYCIYTSVESVGQYLQEIKDVECLDLEQLGYKGKNPKAEFSATFYSILKQSEPGDKIVCITTGVSPGYPAVLQAGRNPGSRYLHGMIVAMLLMASDKHEARFHKIFDQVIDNYGNDILKNEPELIFFQDSILDTLERRFDFVVRFMKDYRPIGIVKADGCYVYQKEHKQLVSSPKELDSSKVIMLKLLLGQISQEEAAKALHMEPKDLDRYRKRIEMNVEQALDDGPGGGEVEAREQLRQVTEERDKLKRQIEKLQH